MKRIVQLAVLVTFLLPSVSGKSPEKMMVFSYERPYKYEMIDGIYKVQASIEGMTSTRGIEVVFNGEKLTLNELEDGTVQIWLPLVGDPGLMEIS